MKIEVIGIIPWLISLIVIFKRHYGWPSDKKVRIELTLFRTFYFEWEQPTKHWD